MSKKEAKENPPSLTLVHFGDLNDESTAPGAVCGIPFLECGNIDYRRSVFLHGTNRCPTCVAIAQAYCPEVEA